MHCPPATKYENLYVPCNTLDHNIYSILHNFVCKDCGFRAASLLNGDNTDCSEYVKLIGYERAMLCTCLPLAYCCCMFCHCPVIVTFAALQPCVCTSWLELWSFFFTGLCGFCEFDTLFNEGTLTTAWLN